MLENDIDLINRAKGGNIAAFESLIFRYDRQVLSIAASYVNNSEDAKDIYQEVLLRVYRALPKFEHRSEFSTWLFRITTNVCLSHRSRSGKHQHAPLEQDGAQDDDETHRAGVVARDDVTPEDTVVSTEMNELIDKAMMGLSPQQRLAFSLKHYEGYKIREIAEMMGCAEGTVKKYLFEAVQRLKKQLKDVV